MSELAECGILIVFACGTDRDYLPGFGSSLMVMAFVGNSPLWLVRRKTAKKTFYWRGVVKQRKWRV